MKGDRLHRSSGMLQRLMDWRILLILASLYALLSLWRHGSSRSEGRAARLEAWTAWWLVLGICTNLYSNFFSITLARQPPTLLPFHGLGHLFSLLATGDCRLLLDSRKGLLTVQYLLSFGVRESGLRAQLAVDLKRLQRRGALVPTDSIPDQIQMLRREGGKCSVGLTSQSLRSYLVSMGCPDEWVFVEMPELAQDAFVLPFRRSAPIATAASAFFAQAWLAK